MNLEDDYQYLTPYPCKSSTKDYGYESSNETAEGPTADHKSQSRNYNHGQEKSVNDSNNLRRHHLIKVKQIL